MKRKLTARSLQIPFKESFRHASAERVMTQTVWVVIESVDGIVGLGEGCPREYVTGETMESVFSFIESIRAEAELLADAAALRSWVVDHHALIDTHPAAWCAVELALLDVMAKESMQSVEALLELPALSGTYQYTAVLGADDEMEFAKKFERYRSMGFRNFKLKLSGTDADFIRENVLLNAGDGIDSLRLDANNLWTDSAIAIAHLERLRLPYFAIEEPLSPNRYAEFLEIGSALNRKIILDESLLRLAQLEHLSGVPNPWIINLRVSKMGGILRSLGIAERAIVQNIPLIIGCQVGETSLLTRAALTIAQSIKNRGLLAQEGALGSLLLQRDGVEPELVFGAEGKLDITAHHFSQALGFGLRSV